MATRIYVGGLSPSTNNESIEKFFGAIGAVSNIVIICDKASERPKGFGFVEFENADEAKKATAELNGKELDGKVVVVAYAKERINPVKK